MRNYYFNYLLLLYFFYYFFLKIYYSVILIYYYSVAAQHRANRRARRATKRSLDAPSIQQSEAAFLLIQQNKLVAMEFIGGDSSSDSDDEYVQNETKQVAPPDAPMMEVKTSTHVPTKSFSRPTGKKTDVNVKMKLKLLKKYEKRFGKITAPKSVGSDQQEKIAKNKPVK